MVRVAPFFWITVYMHGWHVQLEQVKANLRDVIRSQKLTTDTRVMMARASAVLDASSQTQMRCAHHEMMGRKRYAANWRITIPHQARTFIGTSQRLHALKLGVGPGGGSVSLGFGVSPPTYFLNLNVRRHSLTRRSTKVGKTKSWILEKAILWILSSVLHCSLTCWNLAVFQKFRAKEPYKGPFTVEKSGFVYL